MRAAVGRLFRERSPITGRDSLVARRRRRYWRRCRSSRRSRRWGRESRARSGVAHAPARVAGRLFRAWSTGNPRIGRKVAKNIASVPGHVHCFSIVETRRSRLIWGKASQSGRCRSNSGARRPAALVTEAYSTGCPDLSPDRHELFFTANDAAGGAEIRLQRQPRRARCEVGNAGLDPVWLSNGEDSSTTSTPRTSPCFRCRR